MPVKRCVETKNKCLLFVDYCSFQQIRKEKGPIAGLGRENQLMRPEKRLVSGLGEKKRYSRPAEALF